MESEHNFAHLISARVYDWRRDLTKVLVVDDQVPLRRDDASNVDAMPRESSRNQTGSGVELGALLIHLMEQCRRQLAPSIVLGLNSRLGGETYLDAREAEALEFVICEIVSNAYRYAHPEGAPVEITIECRT